MWTVWCIKGPSWRLAFTQQHPCYHNNICFSRTKILLWIQNYLDLKTGSLIKKMFEVKLRAVLQTKSIKPKTDFLLEGFSAGSQRHHDYFKLYNAQKGTIPLKCLPVILLLKLCVCREFCLWSFHTTPASMEGYHFSNYSHWHRPSFDTFVRIEFSLR